MSDPIVTSPIAPVVPAVVATPVEPPKQDAEPHWLRGRLDETRAATEKKILAELGIGDLSIAKGVFAEAKARAEAQKTELDRITEVRSENEALKAALEKNAKAQTELDTIKLQRREERAKQADEALAKLTPAQRAQVVAIAGDRKGRALRVIDAMKPAWDEAMSTLPAPATTTASSGTPRSDGGPNVDHQAAYAALNDPKSPSYNPLMAQQVLLANLHPSIGYGIANEIQSYTRQQEQMRLQNK